MSLKSELQTIDGVGEATASKIMEVLDEHYDNTAGIRDTLEEALEYYEQGDENICAEHVEKALQEL